MLEQWRLTRNAPDMFGKGGWGREDRMDSRTAANVAAHDPDYESVSEELSPRQARDRNNQAKEIENLIKKIGKKNKEIAKFAKAGRTKDAERAQSEVAKLQKSLESRRREMARQFR